MNSADIEIAPAAFHAALDVMSPRVGNPSLALRLLRARAAQTGYFPWRLYPLLRPLQRFGPDLFIGKTIRGTQFLGSQKDRYGAVCAACPDADEPLVKFLCSRMAGKPGSTYVDVGTNMGVVAASVASSVKSNGTVVAFEPSPETADHAAATFALNGLTNIRLFRTAVGDVDGTITFYLSPGSSEAASAMKTDQRIPVQWEETTVPCLTLDRLFKQGDLGRPTILKIDVEGHEIKVLNGARDLLASCRPEIVFEYYPDVATAAGWDCDDVRGALDHAGPYSLHVLRDDGDLEPLPDGSNPEWLANVFCQPD